MPRTRRRISRKCLAEIQRALDEYTTEVDKANLSRRTKRTYLQHAGTFVRWLDDNFVPGGRGGRSG